MRYVFLARFSSPATQTSAKSLSPKTDFPLFLLREHLVNLLKVSFAVFVYAQNTQQSSRTTDEQNTGSWALRAWQGSIVPFGSQQTTPKLPAAPNNPNHQGYKIRFPDFWLAQNWKVCGVPCVFDETEGSVAMGDLDWLCAKVKHENAEK